MKVAAIQLRSGVDRDRSMQRVMTLMHDAVQKGAQCLVLPENFAQMGKHETDKLEIAESEGDGVIQNALAGFAHQNAVYVIAGAMPMQSYESNRVYAQQQIYAPDGQCLARYNKIHLFDVNMPNSAESYQESRGIVPGAHLQTVEVGGWCIGLSICYDLRFPELYRRLQAAGAEILIVPAAFTATTGKVHWLSLLRARAIENQCYVIAPNQGGRHENGRSTYGHSVIIDPWGEVLAEAAEDETVILASLDKNALHEIRRRFPVLQHQRIDAQFPLKQAQTHE